MSEENKYLLSTGKTEYTVIEASEHTATSSGRKSIKLVLQAKDENGKSARVFDYLSPASTKTERFMKSHKIDYDPQVPFKDYSKLVGLKGYFENNQDSYNGKDQNKVFFYYGNTVKDSNKQLEMPIKKADSAILDSDFDDDIPF